MTATAERDNSELSANPRPVAPVGTAVENREFAAFGRRIIRAHARRVAAADPTALRDLVQLRDALEAAMDDATASTLHAAGFSWTEIGRELGVSRQAARQRWGGAA